jgi:mono/diheme cytochrome c family protein
MFVAAFAGWAVGHSRSHTRTVIVAGAPAVSPSATIDPHIAAGAHDFAYLRAGLPSVPTAVAAPIPTGQGMAVEGATLYVRYGCINCHGPNGLGGVPNPLSPDKTIPPLSGVAFRKQFNTEAKIIAVIRSGSVIGRAPIVSMPHWGGIIPDDQLKALVAYLKTLKCTPRALDVA